MISSNKIIGALVYRTREALDKNQKFKDSLMGYTFAPNFLFDGHFHLWHFVVTP